MPMGWEPVAYAEIEDFPSAILAARFPETPNLGDITKVDWSKYRGAAEIVTGGTPCQSFSMSGNRQGLLDPRGQLMLEFVRAVNEIRPRWFLWENVPGCLSQDKGRAFGTFLRELDELGYSCAWRVFDAQFARVPVRDDSGAITGWVGPVPQRRRRVFLIGHIGAGGGPSAVLFEQESMRGNPKSSKEEREALASETRGRSGCTDEQGVMTDVQGFCPGVSTTGHLTLSDELSPTVRAQSNDNVPAIAIRTANQGANGCGISEEVAHTLECTQPEAVAVAVPNSEAEAVGGLLNDNPIRQKERTDIRTSNGSDVFPTLYARDGKSFFIDNQSIFGGRLILVPNDSKDGDE